MYCPHVGSDHHRRNCHHDGSRKPRAEAVLVSGDRIITVGSGRVPGSEPGPGHRHRRRGTASGFVEPHGHPVIAGIATQSPARSIAPWDARDLGGRREHFADALAKVHRDTPLWFAGSTALSTAARRPKAPELDQIFGDRVAIITDNSGHGIYFNTALMREPRMGRQPSSPTPSPPTTGRSEDGSLDGQAFELPAVLEVAGLPSPRWATRW